MSRIAMKMFDLYQKSPYALRAAAGSLLNWGLPPRIRYGSLFLETSKQMEEREYRSREDLDILQNRELLLLIDHAYRHVPYYRNLFDSHAIRVTDIKDQRDLKKIPYLTKEIVREHGHELLAGNIPPSQIKYATTGGTTGKPLGFYINKSASVREWAFMTALWKRAGYTLDSRRAVLRGIRIRESNQGAPYEFDPLLGELRLSVFQLDDPTIRQYIALINKYRIRFIHGYPSAIMQIAKYLEQQPSLLKTEIKAILACSETLFPGQREYLEKVFNTRFFSWYGHSEKAILAGECEHSSRYHVIPEYGICEVDSLTEDKNAGELVGTSFLNYAMPFIRYKTEDFAVRSHTPCPCGRNHMLLDQVQGRWNQEVIVGISGNAISMTALNMHSNIFDRVKQFQLFQTTAGIVTIRVVPLPAYSNSDSLRIVQDFVKKTGDQVAYSIELTEELPKTERGKFKFIEQKIRLKKDDGV